MNENRDIKRRVILVDDHALFRVGLRALLERYADVEVIGEASDGDEFVAMVEQGVEVDVVLMDISMERMSGDVATQRALAINPELKIITLSMFGAELYYSRMVKSGARGFLLKNSAIDEVIEAIEEVCEGGDYFSEDLLRSFRGTIKTLDKIDESEQLLSPRELEILVGICQGLSSQEIGEELYISKRTVDNHRANIMEKTGCRNTANLVAYAIKRCLVDF